MGAMLWIGLGFLAPPEGVPMAGEAGWARLWAPSIVLMGAGFASLLIGRGRDEAPMPAVGLLVLLGGLGLMVVGNIAEYWIFVEQPHGAMNARNVSWMVLLVGGLVALVGAAMTGTALLRRRRRPTWLGLAFLAVVPATILVGLFQPSHVGFALGVLTIVVSAYRLVTPLHEAQPSGQSLS
jgi:hypothetical protein